MADLYLTLKSGPPAFDPNEFAVPTFDPNEFASAEPSDPNQLTYKGLWNQAADMIPEPVSKAWEYANKPLLDYVTDAAGNKIYDPAYAANYYDNPAARTEDQWKIPDWVPIAGGGTYRSLGAGALEGVGNVIAGFTSPLNLAGLGTAKVAANAARTARTLPGLTEAAYTTAPRVARAATMATKALGAPIAAHGAMTIANPNLSVGERLWGVPELAGGGAMMKAPMPTQRPQPKGAGALENLPIKEPPVDLPLNEPAAGIEPPMPVRPNLPPEFSPDVQQVNQQVPELGGTTPQFTAQPGAQVFDPNTLVGLRRTNVTELIPKEARNALKEMGFTNEQINTMNPERAREILSRPGFTTESPAEVPFVNPQTGEVRPASQAQPGDVPDLSNLPSRAELERGFGQHTMEGEDVLDGALGHANAERTLTLPRNLAGAKPRMWIGNRSHTPLFADDLDRALYIIAQTRRSRADAAYLKWVMDNTGMSEAEARAAGKQVKEATKSLITDPDVEVINVPSIARSRGLVSRAGVINRPGTQKIGALPQPKSFTDWIKTLATEEEGSFDPEAIARWFRRRTGLSEEFRRTVDEEHLDSLPLDNLDYWADEYASQGHQDWADYVRDNPVEVPLAAIRRNMELWTDEDLQRIVDNPSNRTDRMVNYAEYLLEQRRGQQANTPNRSISPALRQELDDLGIDSISFDRLPDAWRYYRNHNNDAVANYIWDERIAPQLDRIAPDQIDNFINHYTRSGEQDIAEYLHQRQENLNLNRQSTTTSHRDMSENVSEENRNMINNFSDNELRDYIDRNIHASPYTVSGDILEYARQVLNDRVSQASRTRTTTATPSFGSGQRPSAKTLTEVDEAQTVKHGGALKRLGNIIGDELATKLATEDIKLKYDEPAPRVGGSKRITRYEAQGWSNWGNDEVYSNVSRDPSKPGMEVIEHNTPDNTWDPDRFEIKYRDKDGEPLGILQTDYSGKKISIFGVRSDIGLRRGRVFVEMIKEAARRGATEPSGTTSGNTKNFIERFKRLAAAAKDESGYIDVDRLIEIANKVFDNISKAGKFVGRKTREFLRDEEGSVDMDRLMELYSKQRNGTITPAELAEAKQIAQQSQAAGVAPNPGQAVTQSLSQRLHQNKSQPGELVDKSQLEPNIPIQKRKLQPTAEQSTFNQVWNAPRSLQSIDLPGVTSAALRQSRPLAFTPAWFRAWGKAVSAFGSKNALDSINAKIKNSKYFKPRYEPKFDSQGNIVKYVERKSIAEELGVQMTDVIGPREEAIVSALVEKIPLYGRYVKASNRAYTGFLNDLRAAKFEQLMEGAKSQGLNPETNVVLGKKIADFVNNATGRGKLEFHNPVTGKRFVNLEPVGVVLGDTLYSPRALSARLSFMNPYNYMQADKFVRNEYWKGLARIGASWGAFAGLASLMPGTSVSLDPNNADFGKIRIGNTRIDPGAGWQQLMVLTHRALPSFGNPGSRSEFKRFFSGGGGSVSSTGKPGRLGKYNEFGSTPMASTRLSSVGRYVYNQLNPSLRFIFDLIGASQKEPFDLTDRTIQMALPMYATDIADAAKDDNVTAEFFAPLLSSIGAGVQTYEKGDFGKPSVTPLIKKLTGVDLPTYEFR